MMPRGPAVTFIRKMSIKLFEETEHTKLYKSFRPSHPASLTQFVISSCKEKLDQQKCPIPLAVDVGCGSGQSTMLLAEHCKKIIGFDASSAQIDEAKKNNLRRDVEFLCSTAESLPLADESVSLVTCAQAFHWLDPDKFYNEVNRILMPGGCLAIFGYHLNEFEPSSCNEIVKEFSHIKLKDYWDKRRSMVDNGYKDVELPYSGGLRRDDFKSVAVTTLENYLGYLSTMSSYRKYLKEHPNEPILENVKQQFLEALGLSSGSSDVSLKVIRRYFLLICSKPRVNLIFAIEQKYS